MKLSVPFITILMATYQAGANTESPDTARLIASSIAAEPIERIAPKFPKREAKRGNEGWTQVSFVVGTDGKPYDVSVINSSGSRYFDRASIDAVKQWQYSPASVNGQPIEQCKTNVQLDYRLSGSGVSKKFYLRLKRALEHLKAGDETLIAESIGELEQLGARKMADTAWLSYVKANYYNLTGDSDKELFYLRRTIPYTHKNSKNSILPEQTALYSLQQLFILQAKKSLYQDALQTFRKLQQFESKEALLAINKLAPYNERIEQAIAGDKIISVAAHIGSSEQWDHNLSRSRFSISEIQGNLRKLDVRCANKRHIYTVNDSTEWIIPASWGQCQLLVNGDKGSQFKLIELPQQS